MNCSAVEKSLSEPEKSEDLYFSAVSCHWYKIPLNAGVCSHTIEHLNNINLCQSKIILTRLQKIHSHSNYQRFFPHKFLHVPRSGFPMKISFSKTLKWMAKTKGGTKIQVEHMSQSHTQKNDYFAIGGATIVWILHYRN